MATPWNSLVASLSPTRWYKCNDADGASSLADSGSAAASILVRNVVSDSLTVTGAGFSVAGLSADSVAGVDKAIQWNGTIGAAANLASPVRNNFTLAVSFKNTVSSQLAGIFQANGTFCGMDNGASTAAGNLLSVTIAAVEGNIAVSGALGNNTRHFLTITKATGAAGAWRVKLDGVTLTVTSTNQPNSEGTVGIAGDLVNHRWPFTGIADEAVVFNAGALTAAQEDLLYQTWLTDRTTAGRVMWKKSGGVGVSGSDLTAMTNGDHTDGFATATTKTYVGLDFGVAVPIDTVALANPQANQIANQYGRANTGISIYGASTDPNVSGTPTAIASITDTIVDGELNTFTVSGTYRYVASNLPTYDAGKQYLNEFQVYGPVNSGVPASSAYQPLPVVCSPPPGRYPRTLVTLSSPTTSALIYYTIDGSTPDTSKTLYTGTAISITSTTTLKAIAYDVTAGTSSYVSANLFTISEKQFDITAYQTDQLGNRAQLHCGNHIWDPRSGKYWASGMWTRVSQDDTLLDPTYVPGSKVYSTRDLANYTDEGWIVRTLPANTMRNLGVCVTPLRPKIVYCAATGKYVSWVLGAVEAGSPASQKNCMVFTAITPAGPWTQVSDNGANGIGTESAGYGLEDFNLFVDNDGRGYLVAHVGDTNGVHGYDVVGGAVTGMMIFGLSTDFLTVDTSRKVILGSTNHEAPFVFRRKNTYFQVEGEPMYYCSSDSFATTYRSGVGADPVTATWSSQSAVFSGAPLSDAAPYNNNTQSNSVVPLVGWVDSRGEQAFVYQGDYWTQPYTGDSLFWKDNPSPYVGMIDSKIVMAPILFPTDTTMQIVKPGIDTGSTAWSPGDFFVQSPTTGVGVSTAGGSRRGHISRFAYLG